MIVKIETKYDIGQEVWFKSFGYNKCATIYAINIIVFDNNDTEIRYKLSKHGSFYDRAEFELFPTKEELLKRL